jgi:hypothetical protein
MYTRRQVAAKKGIVVAIPTPAIVLQMKQIRRKNLNPIEICIMM